MNIADASAICHCSIEALRKWVIARDLPRGENLGFKRSNGVESDSEVSQEILRLRERGWTFAAIGRLVGMHSKTVARRYYDLIR